METHVHIQMATIRAEVNARREQTRIVSTYMCCVNANLTAIDAVQNTVSTIKKGRKKI